MSMRLVTRIGVALGAMALCLGAGAAGSDVVAVVSSNSPVITLSKNQIADIFLGKATRFPGGYHAVPIDLREGSVERDAFYTLYTGKSAAQLKAHWSRIIFTGRGQPPTAVLSSDEMKKRLVANPAAIGYMERSQVDSSIRVVL